MISEPQWVKLYERFIYSLIGSPPLRSLILSFVTPISGLYLRLCHMKSSLNKIMVEEDIVLVFIRLCG